MEPSSFKVPRLSRRGLQFLLWAIAVFYLLQAFTPLRLAPDSVWYLGSARSAFDGTGFHPTDVSYFPPGYPAFVALLIVLGVATPAGLVVLNLAFLAIAAAASWKLYRRVFGRTERFSAILVGLTLLSWVVIKHSAMPLSECLFSATVLTALVLMDIALRSESLERRIWTMIAAGGMCLASIAVRTVGVALLPALVMTGWAMMRRIDSSRSSQVSRWWPALPVMLTALATPLVIGIETLSTYREQRATDTVSLGERLSFHLLEAGELIVNVPASRLPDVGSVAVAMIGGSLLLGALLVVGWRRRHRLHPVDAFTAAYLGILLTWPYYDPRFWMPVIVPIGAYLADALNGLPKLRGAYVLWIAATGFGALLYSLSLTFSGGAFPERFGEGSVRAEYCAAIYECEPDREPRQAYIEVLRSYYPQASQYQVPP